MPKEIRSTYKTYLNTSKYQHEKIFEIKNTKMLIFKDTVTPPLLTSVFIFSVASCSRQHRF